jgi:hypothetical protein
MVGIAATCQDPPGSHSLRGLFLWPNFPPIHFQPLISSFHFLTGHPCLPVGRADRLIAPSVILNKAKDPISHWFLILDLRQL